MSDHYGNPIGYRLIDDNDQKCMSLGDEGRIDSGIASMTLSDVEKERQINERIGESIISESIEEQQMSEEDRKSSFFDEGLGTSIPQQTDFNRSFDDAVESIDYRDQLYEPYILVTEYGISPLHNVILEEKTNEAIDLISTCPEPACLDYFTSEIHTALHLAVYKNLPEIVRFLIVYGANFNSTDKRGNTPLHLACELGRLSCVKMIISPLDETESIGAQERNIPQDINMKNYEGLTPLHLAAINNHPEVVEFLVRQRQIKVNIGDSTCGRTALHHALERRHKQCFISLLKGSVNVNATTYDGCSPLHVAVGLELEQETRYLMTRGANVQIATTDDIRAMDLARTQKIRDALQYSMLQTPNLVARRR